MQKISPFLWFNTEAEEAAKFYTSIFKNSKITNVSYYPQESPGPKELWGKVMTVAFELDGQEFTALNGGPIFKFNEAISFTVNCKDQNEIDHYWNKLTAEGGKEIECGWLRDKYGVSWQIVPNIVGELASKGDKEKSERMFKALWTMKKLDVAQLKKAYEG
jgi:predicted 3-demethylubiquinone-9 3-methyltransferase (glyoxalase superfamily)